MTLAVQAKAGMPTLSLGGPRLPSLAPCAAEFATIYIATYVYITRVRSQFDRYFQAIKGFRATETFVGHRLAVQASFSIYLAAAPCGFRRLWACVSTSSAANAFSRANCRKRASAIQSYPTTFTPQRSRHSFMSVASITPSAGVGATLRRRPCQKVTRGCKTMAHRPTASRQASAA